MVFYDTPNSTVESQDGKQKKPDTEVLILYMSIYTKCQNRKATLVSEIRKIVTFGGKVVTGSVDKGASKVPVLL